MSTRGCRLLAPGCPRAAHARHQRLVCKRGAPRRSHQPQVPRAVFAVSLLGVTSWPRTGPSRGWGRFCSSLLPPPVPAVQCDSPNCVWCGFFTALTVRFITRRFIGDYDPTLGRSSPFPRCFGCRWLSPDLGDPAPPPAQPTLPQAHRFPARGHPRAPAALSSSLLFC